MNISLNRFFRKYNIYKLLNNIFLFTKKTFVKETRYPIISIILFILVIILNSIQYSKNEKYLQNKITQSISTDKDKLSLQNALLYFYDIIGINSFIINGLAHILFYILTYFCLSLIELNIGHIPLLFLLLIDILFNFSWHGFQDAICNNKLDSSRYLESSYHCCGSFILFMSLGFVLYLIQKNINSWIARGFVLFLILSVWIGTFLSDYFAVYDDESNPRRTCMSFTWHAANYIFGILCAVGIGN
jgi:hypothetical protein